MLRFFRSTRQKLLNENKAVRYIKYAVGEVLLIMIGIFLALQLNNWNEGRKKEQQRVELIENLKADFRINLNVLDETVTVMQQKHDDLLLFQQASVGEKDDLSVPDLKALWANVFSGGYRFQPAIGTYESALSTGSIGLIRDSKLNELFILFEDANVRFQTFAEVSRLDRLTGGSYEIRKKLGSINVMTETSSFTPKRFTLSDDQYMEIIGDKEVYGILEARLELISRMVRISEELNGITEEILAALEEL